MRGGKGGTCLIKYSVAYSQSSQNTMTKLVFFYKRKEKHKGKLHSSLFSTKKLNKENKDEYEKEWKC